MTTAMSCSPEQLVAFALLHEKSAETFFGREVIEGRSEEALKRIYKRLALKLHPDKNTHPDAGRAFQVLQTLFESSLVAFTTVTPPAARPHQEGAPQHKTHHPKRTPAEQKPAAYPPPPPPPPQPSSQPRHPPHNANTRNHTHSGWTDDIPLPPDVFEDLAWEEWSEVRPPTNGHKASAKPPPPPPPPPQATSSWPPPPPPPLANQDRVRKQPSGDKAQSPRATCSALPSIDISDDDDSAPTRRRKTGQERLKQPKHRDDGRGEMPSLSEASSDDESDARRAKLKARRKREADDAAVRKEAEAAARRVAASSKSLKQLFAEFEISDDEAVDVGGIPGGVIQPQRLGGKSGPSATAAVSHSPRGAGGHQSVYTDVAAPSLVVSNQSPAASSRPVSSRQAKVIGGTRNGFTSCPSCGSPNVPLSPFGDPSMAVQCNSCAKFFVPSMPTTNIAIAAEKKKKTTSSSGAGRTAPGDRCSCGKTRKGQCFLCE